MTAAANAATVRETLYMGPVSVDHPRRDKFDAGLAALDALLAKAEAAEDAELIGHARDAHEALIEEVRKALPERGTVHSDMPPYMRQDQERTNRAHEILDRLLDVEYAPAYQDEYRRLWHEAAAERDRLRQVERAAEQAQRAGMSDERKFKPGDTLPTGEVFIGYAEDSPMWAEPAGDPHALCCRRCKEAREALDTVDEIEDALAEYFAQRDIPMRIRQAVDAFEIARAALTGDETAPPPPPPEVSKPPAIEDWH